MVEWSEASIVKVLLSNTFNFKSEYLFTLGSQLVLKGGSIHAKYNLNYTFKHYGTRGGIS